MVQQILLVNSIGIFLARLLIAIGMLSKTAELFSKNDITEKIIDKKKNVIKQLSIINSAPVEITKEKAKKQEDKEIPKKHRQLFNKKNILAWVYLFSSLFIFSGFLIKITSVFWIIFLTTKLKRGVAIETIFLVAFFILILFTDTGSLTVDKILK